MSVYRASRVYSVPESTLRDRTRHNVDIDCRRGPARLFTEEEEKKLVDHIVYMASIGYGYSVMDIRIMAADYGRSMGKDIKAKGLLSADWFYSLMDRREKLKTVKPQKLGLQRAKTASKETISSYFHELRKVLQEHDLMEAPERIWNIDESGISTEHAPPKIVCDINTKPQSVTSPRSKTVTIIGGANALGNHVPPFYIFPGKRWQDTLLEGSVAGSVGRMTDSGWINRGVFEEYITTHLARYAGLTLGDDRPASLILYDGHKSHISLTLTNWAKDRNVILFVLPPHSSHLTQPLDVGVFGPMKLYYNRECRAYMHDNPGVSITTRDIAHLTAVPFVKAFSTENITGAFRKAGIYPFDAAQITDDQTAPATIYTTEQENNAPESEQPQETPDQPQDAVDKGISFIDSIKITKVVQRPRKKFQPPLKISGNLLSSPNMASIVQQHEKRQSMVTVSKGKSKGKSAPKTVHSSPQPSTSGVSVIVHSSPQPSTSGVSVIVHNPPEDCTSDTEEDGDEDKCSICHAFEPPQVCASTSDDDEFTYVKWGQCDICEKWVHLKYCTKTRVLRRGTFFKCPKCENN